MNIPTPSVDDMPPILPLLNQAAHYIRNQHREINNARIRERTLQDLVIRMANSGPMGAAWEENLADHIELVVAQYQRRADEAIKENQLKGAVDRCTPQPPVDNAHVADGCEQFGQQEASN